MRTRMFSPLLLLVGLTLGLLAMWAVASPLGATGDLGAGRHWEAIDAAVATKMQASQHPRPSRIRSFSEAPAGMACGSQ